MKNITLVRAKNEVKILFNRGFYDIGSIKEALQDYKDIATGRIIDNERIEVHLKLNRDVNADMAGLEFCNYVLAIMKNTEKK